METKKKYIVVEDLEVYKLAHELSKLEWEIYKNLNWQDKKIMGDQFISSTDSVGANIVERYKRFRFLDKVKFYYISRASLAECSEHWAVLLFDRDKITKEQSDKFKDISKKLEVKLNNFIASTYNSKAA